MSVSLSKKISNRFLTSSSSIYFQGRFLESDIVEEKKEAAKEKHRGR